MDREAAMKRKQQLAAGDHYFLHVQSNGKELRFFDAEPTKFYKQTHYVMVIDVDADGTVTEEVSLTGKAKPWRPTPYGTGWEWCGKDQGWPTPDPGLTYRRKRRQQ
jgi:hypothetical protein